MTDSRIRDAEALQREAERTLSRSKVLQERGDFGGALEAAQHAIELAVKSMLVRCDVHAPAKHDVSPSLEIIVKKLDGCSERLRRNIGRSQWIMQMWEPANVVSVYGTHTAKPLELFHDYDGQVAIHYAEEVYWTCYHLHEDLKNGRAKIR